MVYVPQIFSIPRKFRHERCKAVHVLTWSIRVCTLPGLEYGSPQAGRSSIGFQKKKTGSNTELTMEYFIALPTTLKYTDNSI